ncbi:MAG TPA: DUF2490 domain-containing protein [Bacteroidales bacterium]|nr:DUF2490 domain-containing protein [Bacteroidales bacterium]HRZ76995.1 DUF2490 domain-containing protein [Bacteroidales bacterium]
MNIKALILYFLLVYSAADIMAQSSGRAGVLPSITYSHKLGKAWDYSAKLESRHRLLQYGPDYPEVVRYEYLLSDLTFLAARKIGGRAKLAGGFRLRLEPGSSNFQSIQQFIFRTDASGLRIAQRLAADQTFATGEDAEFRFRYRAALELPLNGQQADPGEYYLKFSNEYLGITQGGKQELEIRAVGLIGYSFLNGHKLEAGIDQRADRLLHGPARHSSWLSLNWYVK